MWNFPIPGARELRWARFFEVLASLLDAGLQPRAALAMPAVRKGLPPEALRRADQVLERGGMLSAAFADAGLPRRAVARVAASERAGRTAEGLRRLGAEWQRNVDTIRGALGKLAYPVFVLHFAGFARAIAAYAGSSDVGAGIAAFLLLVVPVDAGLLLLLWAVRNASEGGAVANLALRVPGARTLMRDAALAPFLRSLADLYDSGVPLDRATAIACEESPAFLKNPILGVSEEVRSGHALTPALAKTTVADDATLALLGPAEVSGTLSEAFGRAAGLTEQRLAKELQIAASIPGRLLYAIAVIAVLWILLSFYGGMYGGGNRELQNYFK